MSEVASPQFTKRELEIIYATMQWNPDIDCSGSEFDEILNKIREAAGIKTETGEDVE